MKIFIIFLYLILFFNSGCGVKGRPLPPVDPVEIGYGQPEYGTLEDEDEGEDTEENEPFPNNKEIHQ